MQVRSPLQIVKLSLRVRAVTLLQFSWRVPWGVGLNLVGWWAGKDLFLVLRYWGFLCGRKGNWLCDRS